ncbi:hypothetical protein V6N13_131032 [Hibiscus sabdariffa]
MFNILNTNKKFCFCYFWKGRVGILAAHRTDRFPNEARNFREQCYWYPCLEGRTSKLVYPGCRGQPTSSTIMDMSPCSTASQSEIDNLRYYSVGIGSETAYRRRYRVVAGIDTDISIDGQGCLYQASEDAILKFVLNILKCREWC